MNILYTTMRGIITMNPLELFLKRIFGIDPELADAAERTERLRAVVNGDIDWMLTCKYKESETIKCDDGNDYQKVK